MGDFPILFPPVPPPVLFHSWPYRQPNISVASIVTGRFGLESEVWHIHPWRMQLGALEGTSLFGGWEVPFPVSRKAVLSGCLPTSSLSSMRASTRMFFSPQLSWEPPELCLGPAWGLQVLNFSHTDKGVTKDKGKRAQSEPQLCYLVSVKSLAVPYSLICTIS